MAGLYHFLFSFSSSNACLLVRSVVSLIIIISILSLDITYCTNYERFKSKKYLSTNVKPAVHVHGLLSDYHKRKV